MMTLAFDMIYDDQPPETGEPNEPIMRQHGG
jgi:hypothetical protein